MKPLQPEARESYVEQLMCILQNFGFDRAFRHDLEFAGKLIDLFHHVGQTVTETGLSDADLPPLDHDRLAQRPLPCRERPIAPRDPSADRPYPSRPETP